MIGKGRIGFAPFRPFLLGAAHFIARELRLVCDLAATLLAKVAFRLSTAQLSHCSKVRRGDRVNKKG